MSTLEREVVQASPRNRSAAEEIRYEKWTHWPVNWTAVFVGALASFSMVLLFGLVGIALGAYLVGPEHRLVDLKKLGFLTLIFSVCGAFFSSALGGWVAGKIAGILHSEPAMLHGAIVWLVAVPLLVAAAGLGGASLLGGWFAGLGASPVSTATPYVRPDPPVVGATDADIAAYREQQAEYNQNVKKWNEESPRVMRNSALGAATALLLGLVGSVVGGWMASGEPMDFAHHRTRRPNYYGA